MKLRARPSPLSIRRSIERVWSIGGRLVQVAVALVAITAVSSTARAQDAGAMAATVAGTANVSGVITDIQTKLPVENIVVEIVGTNFKKNSDAAGKFSFVGVPYGTYKIVASRIGYSPGSLDNISIRQATITNANIEVNPVALSLRAITTSATSDPISGVKAPFSITKLDAEQMPVPATGAISALVAGKVAGLQVIRASGAPGDGSYVQMRAVSSPFHTNSVLFVLDGVPLNSTTNVTTSDINGMDIESIEVIRGAAAAAIYGSQASGGVIAITTKRGNDIQLGRSVLSSSSYFGTEAFDATRRPPKRQRHIYRVNDQLQWINAAGTVVTKDNRSVDPSLMLDKDYAHTWDPVKAVLKTNQNSNVQVSVAQRSATSNFNLSYGHGRTPGIIEGAKGTTSNNVILNITHQLRDNLNVNAKVNHTRSNNEPSQASFSQLFSWDPDINLLRPDPKSGQKYVALPDTASTAQNPLYVQQVVDNLSRRMRTNVSADVRYTLTNWMSFTSSVGYDRSDSQNNNWTPPGLDDTDGSGLTTGSLSYSEGEGDGLSMTFGNTLNKDIFKMTARLNTSAVLRRERSQSFSATANTFAVAGVKQINAGTTRSGSSSISDSRQTTYRSQLSLDYAGRYIGDAVYTREGNSLFGPTYRWNGFLRAGGSWLISQEAWYPSSLSWLTLAKVRFEHSSAGTPPDFGDSQEIIGTNSSGFVWSSLGDVNLHPEKKTDNELGIDLEFNNKFTAQLTYTKTVTKDAIVGVSAPDIGGFNLTNTNAGKTHGATYEATLEGNLITNRKYTWWANIVLDKETDGMDDLGRPCYAETPNLIYRCDGVALTEFWGQHILQNYSDLYRYGENVASTKKHVDSLVSAGIPIGVTRGDSKDQWEIDNHGFLVPVGIGNHWWEGNAKGLWASTVTIDGVSYAWGRPSQMRDDSTKATWWHNLGSYSPKLNWGMQQRFRYGNVQLYFQVRGRIGGHIFDDFLQQTMANIDHPIVDQTGVPDSLRKPYTYYSLGWANNYSAYPDNFYEGGTYTKLQEGQLQYTFDAKKWTFLTKFGATKVSAQLVGTDLFVWSKEKGLDPEGATTIGGLTIPLDGARYPFSRKIRGSLNITF